MEICKKTHYAFIGSYLLNAPLWAMYSLLVFIFYKDLHANAFEITLLISAKPVVAIFSFYWNAYVDKKRNYLKKSIVLVTLIGTIPCLFFPFVNNHYYYILAFSLYMMASRAIIPGWMEILKLKIDESRRSHVFSSGSTINYLIGLFFPLIVSYWMDIHEGVWRFIFTAAGVVNLMGLSMLFLVPTLEEKEHKEEAQMGITESLKLPWKGFLKLMFARPDFASFQMIFMFGGLGLMVMQPALPVFTVEVLQLSYTKLVIAISICKGIGFALTTRLWAGIFNKLNIYFLTSIMTFLAGLFPVFLLVADAHILFVYLAYLIYGIMQAGSEMCWHLSGPKFAGSANSAEFTSVNVALVGLRGCIGPFLGGFLVASASSYAALILGGVFCLIGAIFALYSAKKYQKEELTYVA